MLKFKKIIRFIFLPILFLKALLIDIPMIELKHTKQKYERLQKRN